MRRAASIAGMLALGLALAGCGGASDHARPSVLSRAPLPCAARSAAARYAIDDSVVHRIYANELASPAVSADRAHVTGAADLLTAVADDNPTQTLAAVTRIVYTPGWHIVRLRVLSSAGQLLADVGGPYVLAPVTGSLVRDGAVVGSYVMSVQDDRGYKKLVHNIAGLPVELYLDGQPLMGTVNDPPSTPPSGRTLIRDGVTYDVDAYNVKTFTGGELRVVVLIATPPPALARESCAAIRLAATVAVITNIAAAFGPHEQYHFLQSPNLFVLGAEEYTTDPIFVLDNGVEIAGTNELNGSTAPLPPPLPDSGKISYDNAHWLVYSFAPYPPDRIYLLEPSGTGATVTPGD